MRSTCDRNEWWGTLTFINLDELSLQDCKDIFSITYKTVEQDVYVATWEIIVQETL